MFSKDIFLKIRASSAANKLLIVPAQLTLSAEQAAFEALGGEGFFDLHVMSGNKLRSEIIRRAGGSGRTMISALGRSMILRKCAGELADAGELKVYGKVARGESFLSAAADYIVQSKQNGRFKADFSAVSENLSPMLRDKLHDMSKISETYDRYMQGRYMDSEDGLAFAAEQARRCEWIKESELWFAGFYSFTAREREFLKALDETGRGCHVLLKEPKEEFPETLKAVYKAGSPQEQILLIGSEILRLIREEGLKAEDIVILSGDMTNDAPAFKRVFGSLGIALYADEKRSFMHMKAARKISNLLDMAADGFRAHSVCEYALSNALSNYVKSYQIKPNMFLEPFKYGGSDKIKAEIARDAFASSVLPFVKSFRAAGSLREKTTLLYNFLADEIKLPLEMQNDALSLADEGYAEAAEESSQGWSVILSIFDQAVELLGDSKISDGEYRDIIKGAFRDIKLGILPQRSGCVLLGDIYRSRINGVKALFISSFNDGKIPRNNNAEGILTEAEQAALSECGITLCKSYARLNREDKAAIYGSFEAAEQSLFFVYTASDPEGQPQKPSYLLNGLEAEPCGCEIFSIEELIAGLRLYKSDGIKPDIKWQTFARTLSAAKSDHKKSTANIRYQAALKGLLYKNSERRLSAAAVAALLGTDRLSPSGLERYAACPYSYFMSRAVRPREETSFKINAADIGNIHHELLRRLASYLSSDGEAVTSENSRWRRISSDEIKDFIKKAAEEIKKEDSSGLYTRGREEEYRTGRAEAAASRFAVNMVRQVRRGNISSIICEEEFELPFALARICGKIDRVDISRDGEKKLIKIVDYKSGKKSFSKERIEKGLDLQLMLYLEAESRDGELPIGTFFFHIDSPVNAVGIDELELDRAFDDMRLDGAFVDERRRFIDKTPIPESSDIVNEKLKFAEADFEALRESFRKKLGEIIERLASGDISVRPQGDKPGACLYCSYKAICAFDSDVQGFEFNL